MSNLSFSEYQEKAKETALYPNVGSNPYYPTLGLTGEAGEISNKVKKIMIGTIDSFAHAVVNKDKIIKETLLKTPPANNKPQNNNTNKNNNQVNSKKENFNSIGQEKRTTNMVTVGEKEELKNDLPPLNVDKYYNMINEIEIKKRAEIRKKKNSMKIEQIDVSKYMDMIEKIDKNKKMAMNN